MRYASAFAKPTISNSPLASSCTTTGARPSILLKSMSTISFSSSLQRGTERPRPGFAFDLDLPSKNQHHDLAPKHPAEGGRVHAVGKNTKPAAQIASAGLISKNGFEFTCQRPAPTRSPRGDDGEDGGARSSLVHKDYMDKKRAVKSLACDQIFSWPCFPKRGPPIRGSDSRLPRNCHE